MIGDWVRVTEGMWQRKLVSELEGEGDIDRMSESRGLVIEWSSDLAIRGSCDHVSCDLVIKGSCIMWSSNQGIKY